MKTSELKALIKEEIKGVLSEAEKAKPTDQHVSDFISDVLKLGSKQNIFDTFIRKNNIDPNELSTFISMVANKLKEKWS